MKRIIKISLLLFVITVPFLFGMSIPVKMTEARVKKPVIQIETIPNLEIHEGYVSQKEETVLVKHRKKTIAKIHLSEPVMVAMAEQEEKWGISSSPA